jgi:hypothetical protein
VEVKNLENPRKEMEDHYYNPDHRQLLDLGYKPTHDINQELKIILTDLIKYKGRIESKKEALVPDILWSGKREAVHYLKKHK